MRASKYLREIGYRCFYVLVSFILLFLQAYSFAPAFLFALFYETSLLGHTHSELPSHPCEGQTTEWSGVYPRIQFSGYPAPFPTTATYGSRAGGSGGEGYDAFLFSSLGEGLTTTLHVAFFVSTLFLVPILLYQVWCYVRPSTPKEEERVLRRQVCQVGGLIFLTVVLTFKGVLPILLPFFLSYSGEYLNLPMVVQPRFTSVLYLMLQTFIGVLFALLCVSLLPVFLQSALRVEVRPQSGQTNHRLMVGKSAGGVGLGQALSTTWPNYSDPQSGSNTDPRMTHSVGQRCIQFMHFSEWCGSGPMQFRVSEHAAPMESCSSCTSCNSYTLTLRSWLGSNRLRGFLSIFALLFVSILSPPEVSFQLGLTLALLLAFEFSLFITCYRQVRSLKRGRA